MSDVYLLLISPFVGSFLGVLVLRLPRGEGVVAGRSRCPHCRTTLGAVDLVPLLSYLLRGGRCRHCGARLSWLYPGIELAA
ncbi:MAG: prepilin peptidase, partial [Kiloniellales bacterium]|nr:prepilin peptidase [Kiloniellales bacterium]